MSIPFDPILSASHSFIERFFESLNYEYRNLNIKFQCIKTLVSCNNNEEADLSLMNVAINSIRYFGGNSNPVCVSNYYRNGFKVI